MISVIVFVASAFLSLLHHTAGIEVIFYFAYGSNLLSNRIKLNLNSSVYYGPAVLQGYELEFKLIIDMWNGAVANIKPNPDKDVWGTLWLIDTDKIHALDKQEGVDKGWYRPANVVVHRPDGYQIEARVYIEVNTSDPHPMHIDDKLPSDTYLEVIILGAMESKLPDSYVEYLKTFKTNKQNATEETIKSLGEVILINTTVHRFA